MEWVMTYGVRHWDGAWGMKLQIRHGMRHDIRCETFGWCMTYKASHSTPNMRLKYDTVLHIKMVHADKCIPFGIHIKDLNLVLYIEMVHDAWNDAFHLEYDKIGAAWRMHACTMLDIEIVHDAHWGGWCLKLRIPHGIWDMICIRCQTLSC